MRIQKRPVLFWPFLASVLGMGILPVTCITRMRDAFIDGSKTFVGIALDPSNIEGYPFQSLVESLNEEDQTP